MKLPKIKLTKVEGQNKSKFAFYFRSILVANMLYLSSLLYKSIPKPKNSIASESEKFDEESKSLA